MREVYWAWDPTNNREVRVVKVLSAVDPKKWRWSPATWRRAVRWACDQWAQSGVVAFTTSFEPDTPYIYPAATGVLQVSVQDPVKETPGQNWYGYMNPHVYPGNLVGSADVWISKDCPLSHVQYTLAHEFGHILGLDHRPYPDKTCMRSPAIKMGPDELDLSSVREAYLA